MIFLTIKFNNIFLFSVPNSLSLLLGDYNSDSDNEDNGMVAKVDEFFNEISNENKRITTS